MENIFVIQDEISLEVLTGVQITLTEGEDARLFAIGSRNLTAYLMYMRGLEQIYRMNKDGIIIARQLLEKVITLDPQFSTAYVILASTHTMALRLGISKSPRQSLMQAVQLAQQAIAIDNSNSMAYGLLCTSHSLMRQHDKAIEFGERAITLNSNNATCRSWLSLALSFAGKPSEAIPMSEKAIRLDPIPQSWFFDSLGFAFYLTGQYEKSIKFLKKSLSRSPNDFYAHTALAAVYCETGRQDKARAEANEVLRIDPNFSLVTIARSYPFKNQDVLKRFVDSLRKAGLK